MEIHLVSGETAFQAAINTIKQIDSKNTSFQNLVVVPDSFSMQAEELIFDTLHISATFNIEVVGISRLASKILIDNSIDFKRISNIEEIFCIFKAMKNCESQFQYFKNTKIELCQKVLLVIKQFLACKILPEKIKEVGDENLDKKMHDLKIIMQEYQKELNDKLDLSSLLQFFLDNSEHLATLQNVNLFFCNFDSFTTEINSFIVSLSKHVHSIHIGISQPLSPKNAHIFENDIFKKTTALAKEANVLVDVKTFPPNLDGNRLALIENVFGLELNEKPTKNDINSQKKAQKFEKIAEITEKDENFHMNIVAKNPRDEVEFLAKYIRFNLFHGAHLKDFSVAVSDKTYFDLIKETFPTYGILANLDDATSLSDTILGSFLLKILSFCKVRPCKEEFEYLCSSPLCGANENSIFEIERLQIDDEDEFIEHFPEYKNLIKSTKKAKEYNKFGDFCSFLIEILEIVKISHENFLKKIEEEKHYKKLSQNQQSFELVEKIIEKLDSCGHDEEMSMEDFENLFALSLSSVKVETIPSYVDAVFVGDATDSYFSDVENLFILGCDQLPKVHANLGLIDDEEIKKLRINFALEPEVRVLNRRNRLKIFELLQHSKTKLITCTPFSRDSRITRTSDFVRDLEKTFNSTTVHTNILEDFDLPANSKSDEFDKLLFFVGCEQNLLNAYTGLLSKNKLPKPFASSLKGVLKNSIPTQKRIEYVSANHILPQNSFSATRLETWFACPFKHMVRYGMNVQEKQTILPDARAFGSFAHEILRRFLTEIDTKTANDKTIATFLQKNEFEVLQMFYDKKILKNKFFLQNLHSQITIIIKSVIKEQKHSNFVPKALEKEVNLKIGNWNLFGKIDRVDECENYFRIIDFKTGSTGSIKSELFYGKKLQLFLYAKAMENQTKKILAGVFYFNAQTRFTKNQLLLHGLMRKENELVELSDTTTGDSKGEILGFSIKKSSKPGEFSYKGGCAEENLDELVEYSLKISEQAINEIESGFVLDKPFEDACKFCPYTSICRHEKIWGERKKINTNSNKNEEIE